MNYPAVRTWLAARASIEPSLLEGAGFETLVAERIAAVGNGSEASYIAALDRSPDEADRLTGGIAVPETWFFRYPESFRVLVDFLKRRLATGAGRLRLMSIGCATGEEPFAMAMTALHAGWTADAISIRAIDRNREVLRRAAAAEYGAFSIRTEVPDWAVAFLRREGETIVVDPLVRSLVDFAQADVLQPGAFSAGGPWDAVFCRNVLIYLSADARSRLLEAICEVVVPGGLLFVGHAEPLLCGGPLLRPVAAPHSFALERIAAPSTRPSPPPVGPTRQAPGGRAPAVRLSAPAPAPTRGPQPVPAEPTLEAARDLADAGRAMESQSVIRAVIARHGPSAPALELLGLLHVAAGDAAAARTCFEQAVYLEPARAASLLQLAILSERGGDPRRAAILWDRARRAAGQEHPG